MVILEHRLTSTALRESRYDSVRPQHFRVGVDGSASLKGCRAVLPKEETLWKQSSCVVVTAGVVPPGAELLSGGGFLGRRNLDLVDKHFAVTKSGSPPAALARLNSLFGLMLTFFARPGGLWGFHAFEAEPFLTAALWYTFAGGYHQAGN